MLSPPETRAADQSLVRRCNVTALQERLPLPWPTPADTPPSPKARYRSHYRYLGCAELADPHWPDELSDFDLLLHLVDFEGLRPVLAQRLGWTSARGQTPFDPLSLFLLHGWQLTNGWSRAKTLRQLKKRRHADYARRFGFVDGLFPTEGGLRYFLTALGRHAQQADQTVTLDLDHQKTVTVAVQLLNQLLAQTVTLIRQLGLLSQTA